MPQRIAVVDLGTNSTRLLIADAQDHSLTELERRTTITRLGEGVDATRQLADPAMDRVFAALAEYRRLIDDLGATTVVGVATSAVRDAENGEGFQASLRDRFGIEAQIISGDEEARLTFLGATAGRAKTDGAAMVVDIGGGSTEYVVGSPGYDPDFHVSTRMGSVRHSERHLQHDPPQPDELRRLITEADEIIAAAIPSPTRDSATTGIAVAGTATTLAAVDQGLESYDSSKVDGYVLTRDVCKRILGQLAAVPVSERRAIPGLHPDRAPTIVAGVAILIQSIAAFGLHRIEVSERDILHGVALSRSIS